MYEFIQVDNGLFSSYSNRNDKYEIRNRGYKEDYQKFYNDKIKMYFEDERTPILKEHFEEQSAELEKQAIEILREKGSYDWDLELIQKAEEVKAKNKEITEYINKLKTENRLNVFVMKQEYSYSSTETIENGTYKFSIRIYIDDDYTTKKINRYDVSYCFSINNIVRENWGENVIQSIDRKVFAGTEKEQMKKYIAGRKKAFEKYFTEEKPPILQKFNYYIKLNGIRLEGYRVEGE